MQPSKCHFRVLPTDTDINLHLNNGRYFSVMDLGRLDLTIRCGLIKACIKKRWLPVVGSQMIKFIREIKTLTKYTLITNFVGHDEKWFYIKQEFQQNNKTVAVAYVRGVFLEGKRKVVPQEIIQALSLGKNIQEKIYVEEEIKNLWNTAEKKLLKNI